MINDFDCTGVRIETERLTLSEWNMNDLADFYEYCKVDGVGQSAGWLPHKSIEESNVILESFIKSKSEFAVRIKESGKAIGSIGVKTVDKFPELDNFRGAELGFVISKDFWGRGLMPEAVRKVISYLFDELDYDVLLCGYYDFNERSKRVQEKCGFVPYRKLVMDTYFGTQEKGTLNILTNPKKNIKLEVSHPETLVLKSLVKTADELFSEFQKATGEKNGEYEAWSFGGAPDSLAGLVYRGEKTATSSAFDVYVAEGEEIPKVGDLSVILNSEDYAVCVIKTTDVKVMKFSEVGEDVAFSEGEGDKTLAYWRSVHEEFFKGEMESVGKEFSTDMKVVVERFEVVYKI